MITNEHLINQKQIFQNLLAETIRDYASDPKRTKGKINIGANAYAFSFRNDGQGIPSTEIASAVLSTPYDQVPVTPISKHYSLNDYVGYEVFELHSWHNGKCTVLKYGRDEMDNMYQFMQFNCYPEFTFTGILVHIEFSPSLDKNQVLTEEEVTESFRKLFSSKSSQDRLTWKPEVWFNGNRVKY